MNMTLAAVCFDCVYLVAPYLRSRKILNVTFNFQYLFNITTRLHCSNFHKDFILPRFF